MLPLAPVAATTAIAPVDDPPPFVQDSTSAKSWSANGMVKLAKRFALEFFVSSWIAVFAKLRNVFAAVKYGFAGIGRALMIDPASCTIVPKVLLLRTFSRYIATCMLVVSVFV
jgi:hypothetical protein